MYLTLARSPPRPLPLSAAYKKADGMKIDGRRVLVDVERSRTVKGWLPRRLGETYKRGRLRNSLLLSFLVEFQAAALEAPAAADQTSTCGTLAARTDTAAAAAGRAQGAATGAAAAAATAAGAADALGAAPVIAAAADQGAAQESAASGLSGPALGIGAGPGPETESVLSGPAAAARIAAVGGGGGRGRRAGAETARGSRRSRESTDTTECKSRR